MIKILLTHLPYQYICPSFLSLASSRIKVFCLKGKTLMNRDRGFLLTHSSEDCSKPRGLQQRKMLKEYWSYNFCFPCLSAAIQMEGLNNMVMKNDCILHSSFIPSTSSDNYRSLTTAPVLQHLRHSSDSSWFYILP